MTLDIAGFAYRVVVLSGRLFFNGDEVGALVDHELREIRISSLVKGAHREELIADAGIRALGDLMGLSPERVEAALSPLSCSVPLVGQVD